MRGLHPCEALTAGRLKRALDELRGEGEAKEEGEEEEEEEEEEEGEGKEDDERASPAAVGHNLPQSAVDHDLRGFRVLPRSGFQEALEEALAQARAGDTKAALLLLVQGAPPLPEVLRGLS